MTVTMFKITREPDDMVLRASVGGDARLGFYLVFRGDPTAVVKMLRDVLAEAERALPAHDYEDHVGRPQG